MKAEVEEAKKPPAVTELVPRAILPKPEPIDPEVSVPTVARPGALTMADESEVASRILLLLMRKAPPVARFKLPEVSEMPPPKLEVAAAETIKLVVEAMPLTARLVVVALVEVALTMTRLVMVEEAELMMASPDT